MRYRSLRHLEAAAEARIASAQPIPDVEIGGAAVAGFTLSACIIRMMQSKRLVPHHEIDRILESSLASIETFLPPSASAAQSARGLVEYLLDAFRPDTQT
jgi:hypothetical protein